MNLNINDIAKLANVSKATVSRVINGTGQVSEKTRQAVMEVVEKYNYHPNSFAQAISTQAYQSNYIAVVVPHSEAYIMSNPVYAELFRGIADVLTPRGYFMLSCFTNDTEHIKNLYLQRRAGGYIILSPTTNDYELLRTLHDIDAPFISTTSVTFAEGQKPFHVPYVDIDNYTAAVMAMEHLVGLGHQRIAFLATNENTSRQGKLASILLRQKAYTDTLAAHSIAVEPQRIVVAASNDVEEDYRTAYTLFSDQPELTAVFCATDLLAIGALKAIKDLGRTVPGDVSLVGFDGIPWARFTDPPLTTVGQDTFSRGRKTAAKLLDYLEKETPMTNEICAAELILVASTAMVK